MRQLKIVKSITNRESQSLEKYLQEIGKEDLLTPEEEVELARRIKQGDREALEKLVRANLRFVVSVAKQYQNQGLPLSDLINEGNLGLIKAAERFDETRGFKFISYAVWWIRQSILQALAENSRIVRLPLNKVGSLNKIHKAYTQLEQEYEREPTPEEIAELTGLNPRDIEKTMGLSGKYSSLDAPFQEGEDGTLKDVVADDTTPKADEYLIKKESMQKDILRILNKHLDKDVAEIIRLFFGIGEPYPMSVEDIAEKMGMSKERVRQLKDRGLQELRKCAEIQKLKDYLNM
ncbi:MAG: RNA polymerase sigma factor RpoD/SigA [Chlorobi bacterium]|nr:RNA polymerase sigma factor RpoD/SigA [Chlorobiota bacterium]